MIQVERDPIRFDVDTKCVKAVCSGKIAALSAQITGNMYLAMSAQKQILTRTPGLMSPRRFGITLVFPTSMSATGSLSKSVKYRQVPGQCGGNNIGAKVIPMISRIFGAVTN